MIQESYETAGVVTSGKLKVQDKEGFDRAIKRFSDGYVLVTIKKDRPTRTSGQNRYWHGVVIPLFADHCGYEFDEMKDQLALKLIPKEITNMDTGEVVTVPGHTSELNTKEFKDLIERAQRLGAEMDIYIPDPGEDVRKAS